MHRRNLITLAWAVVILALCTVPGQNLPDTEIVSLDKFVHFALFYVLAWLWLSAPGGNWKWITVAAGGTLYAAFTEIYQGWLPWERTPDPLDFLANVAGLLAGFLSFAVLRAFRTKPQP
jgi:VanZ family protein